MASQKDDIVGRRSSWSSAVTWTVIDGSLKNTVTYESFYSPINEEKTVDSGSKYPLVLRRPSADSVPCEITFYFAEKHEIRQVYVRSTAKIYEIYCASNSHSENEYLCTVRCGAVASIDEEVLYTAGTEGSSVHMNEPSGPEGEGIFKRSGNLNTNEDDWVEVKVTDSPAPDYINNSSPSMSDAGSVTVMQSFEATAEITDANPCTSLTIRLLSLQNKSFVYVDEVYVFANPVDLEDDSPAPVETSMQSSLMSMLVPTLLQLSKTTSSNRNNDGQTSNAEGIHPVLNSKSKAANSLNSSSGFLKNGKPCGTDGDEVKTQESNECNINTKQSEASVQVPMKENEHDVPLHRIERVLDQLVSRMDRIENCFLRFEQNLLKPINGIEGRLKEVEQQLEVLTKMSHVSVPPSCYRMSAPIFSANESVCNSFCESGNDRPNCVPSEQDTKELHSVASSVAVDDISNSISSALLRPSLVITAPEFANVDDIDDDDEQTLEVKSDLKIKPKPSIDDVLASALAQFALSAIRPLEFENEKDESTHERAFSSGVSKNEINPVSCSTEIAGSQCLTNSALATISTANDGDMSSSSGGNSPNIAEGNDDAPVMNFECENRCVDEVKVALSEKLEVPKEVGNVKVMDETSGDWDPEKIDIPIHLENALDTTKDATEAPKEESSIDIIHDVLGFSCDASILNYEIPILNVSFTSTADSSFEHTLEDLLGDTDTPRLNHETSPNHIESDNSTSIDKQCDLIVIRDEDQVDHIDASAHVSVDMNYCTIMEEPVIEDGGDLQNGSSCSSQSTVILSLI